MEESLRVCDNMRRGRGPLNRGFVKLWRCICETTHGPTGAVSGAQRGERAQPVEGPACRGVAAPV